MLRNWKGRRFTGGVVWVVTNALVTASAPPVAASPAPAPPPLTSVRVEVEVEQGVPVPVPPEAPAAAPGPRRLGRTAVPKVSPPAAVPRFSTPPTDQELFRARVFEEPFIPERATRPDDNSTLVAAIEAFVSSEDREDLSPWLLFVESHPDSPWTLSVLTGLSIASRRAGYFSRAMELSQRAWERGRGIEEPRARAIASRAFAELVEMYARVGRMEELEALLASVEGREFSGAVAERIAAAKQGLSLMQAKPELSFRCGPLAVESVLSALRPGYALPLERADALSSSRGTSLAQIAALSKTEGQALKAVLRPAGERVPAPAVVHWKAGHFAAILERSGERYRVADPTFGEEYWVSQAAIEAEATGYLLVREVPSGWRDVPEGEAAGVWGKGAPNGQDPQYQTPEDRKDCEPCSGGGAGMAAYQFFPMLASLGLSDVPVGYRPPVGPGVSFKVSYSQREAFQPAVPFYGNVGPKWTFGWQSWVEDTPAESGGQSVHVYRRGGGQETYSIPGTSPQVSSEHLRSRARLRRVSSTRYERELPDGFVEVYGQPDGSLSSPRRVFLTEVRDAQGNGIEFVYDEQLRLVAVVDAIGQVTVVEYGHADPLKITKVTDPFGRSAVLEYDGSGRLIRITDVVGLVSAFTYGASDFITALTTPYGTTSFRSGQDKADRWVEATDALGGVERYEFRNGHTNVIPATEPTEEVPAGLVSGSNTRLDTGVTFHWTKRLMALAPGDYSKAEQTQWLWNVGTTRVTGIVRSKKAPLERRVWYEYPGQTLGYRVGTHGSPSRVVRMLDDGTDQAWQYEYNAQGQVTRAIDPLGRERVYEYASNGIDRTVSKRKEGGVLQTLETRTYDSGHRPLTITDRDGGVTTFTYDARGQVLTVQTPPPAGFSTGPTTTYTYDAHGYLTGTSGPVSGATTSYTYDYQGRVKTATDATSYTTTMEYDALDRVVKVTHPDATYEQMEYERLDMVARRDREGRKTRTLYDALRRAVWVQDASNATTSYLWCDCGSLDALVDANGNRTTWDYDLQGRVVKETRANGSSTSYVYETTTSRLKTRTDRRGVVTTYSYFADGQLQARAYSSLSSTVAATPSLTYTYHADTGLPLTAANGTDTLTWTYDGEDRMASEASTLNGTTVGWTYDSAGNRSTVTLGGATFNAYTYDVTSRLTQITHGSLNFGLGYDTASRRTSLTYPNGITTTYTYDAESRITRINAKLGATDITDFEYGYTPSGNRTYKHTLEFDEEYGYDRTDRLVTASRPASSGAPNWLWTYDKVGNRLVDQKADASSITATLSTYDTLNQLRTTVAGGSIAVEGSTNEAASVTVGSTPAQTTASNTFAGTAPASGSTPQQFTVQATDSSGNVRTNTYQVNATSPATATYDYDENGNTTQKVQGADTWVYVWDAENRLVEVKKNGTTQATFRYDPLERRVEKVAGGTTYRFVYDGEDWIRRTGGTTLDIVHGPGIDEPFAQDVSGTLTYYHADALGSVQKHTSAAGTVTQTIEYDAWGNSLAGAPGPYGSTGREPDPETGLMYYRARYYDPKLGRFASEDPLGVVDGPNRFWYVKSDPVASVDPLGLFQMQPPSPRPTPDTCRDDALERYERCLRRADADEAERHGDCIKKNCNPLIKVGPHGEFSRNPADWSGFKKCVKDCEAASRRQTPADKRDCEKKLREDLLKCPNRASPLRPQPRAFLSPRSSCDA
ncbi:MAG: hypothetical protein KJ067_15760 [Vicinamibacteria bacterium]|nr:hypothetical protein [Vicinamibacteria bacterium]